MALLILLVGSLSITARHFVYRELIESLYEARLDNGVFGVTFSWSGRDQRLLERDRQILGLEVEIPDWPLWAGFTGFRTQVQTTQENTRVTHNRQWSWTGSTTWRKGTWQWVPTFTVQRYMGQTRHPKNVGLMLQGKTKGPWGDIPATLQIRLYAQTLTRGGNFSWKLQPTRVPLPVTFGGIVERLRYPLTYTTESRETEEVYGQITKHVSGWIPSIRVEVRAWHQAYAWNRAQNSRNLLAGVQVERTWGFWKILYTERRTWQKFDIYQDGTARSLHRGGSIFFSLPTPDGPPRWRAGVSAELSQVDPPQALAFNTHDRRVIRLELLTQKSLTEVLQLHLEGSARFVDDVFLHPMRSAYTRRDEEYRIEAQVKGPFWTHEAIISAWYSLFRFQPAQNLLIRYLENRWTIARDMWKLTGRVRLQENGRYTPTSGGPYLFYIQRKITEFQAQGDLTLLSFQNTSLSAVAGIYNRWERYPGADTKTTQSEITTGVRYTSSLGEGEILWHRRLRERDYLSADFAFRLSF